MYMQKQSLSTTLRKFREQGPFAELAMAGLQAMISLLSALLLTSSILG